MKSLPVALLVQLLILDKKSFLGSAAECGQWNPSGVNKAVINGTDSEPHRWPWMVSLYINGKRICGGALVSSKTVVTAAHCLMPSDMSKSPVKEVQVVLGAHETETPVTIRGVPQIHPAFLKMTLNDYSHDMAAIVLDKEVQFTDVISPICIPTAQDKVQTGDRLWVIGWGETVTALQVIKYLQIQKRGPVSSAEVTAFGQGVANGSITVPPDSPLGPLTNKTLKQIDMAVVDPVNCFDQLIQYLNLSHINCQSALYNPTWCELHGLFNGSQANSLVSDPSLSICGLNADHKGTCYGDSGGPLMKQLANGTWLLVGVVSYGIPDCVSQIPSFKEPGELYTSTLAHKQWIDDIVHFNSQLCCNGASCSQSFPSTFILSVLLVCFSLSSYLRV